MNLSYNPFMASNNSLPDPTIFSGHDSLLPRRRKHRTSAVTVAFRLRGAHKKHPDNNNSSPVNFSETRSRKSDVSARKLAAGLWQLRFMDGDAFRYSSSFHSSMSHRASPRTCLLQLASGNVKITIPHHHNSGEKFKKIKDQLRNILCSRNELQREMESTMLCLNCSKEESSKRNPALSKGASEEFTMIHNNKCLENKKVVGDYDSVVTTLLEKLLQAQRTINNLKAAKKSSKKKIEIFLQNLENEKLFWKRREWQRIESMLNDLKDQLESEKRSREKMELLNTKLVQELAKANLSARQFMTKYKKEKKEREMTEEVCNELAMQIREDMAKLEGLNDSLKFCKEMEEERKMMEMAELWREEGVQMKLVEAQSMLEDKYNQMVQLIASLQTFLRSRGAEQDTPELEDSVLIKQTIESGINSQGIMELSDEELTKDNIKEGMNKSDSHSPLTRVLPRIHIESLNEEVFEKEYTHPSPSSDYNNGLEQTNSLEIVVNHIEDQKFSSTPQTGHTYSVHVNQDNDIIENGAEGGEKTSLESLRTRVNGVGFVSAGQLKRIASLASKQLRSFPNGGTTISSSKSSKHKRLGDGWYKQKECSNRSSIGSIQNSETTSSQCESSVEGSSATYNQNPHILRGMKGSTEWPRGIPKSKF